MRKEGRWCLGSSLARGFSPDCDVDGRTDMLRRRHFDLGISRPSSCQRDQQLSLSCGATNGSCLSSVWRLGTSLAIKSFLRVATAWLPNTRLLTPWTRNSLCLLFWVRTTTRVLVRLSPWSELFMTSHFHYMCMFPYVGFELAFELDWIWAALEEWVLWL